MCVCHGVAYRVVRINTRCAQKEMFVAVAATVVVCSVDQPKCAHSLGLCEFFFSVVLARIWCPVECPRDQMKFILITII